MIFAKQVCGIDGSPTSEAAAEQAARLANPGTDVLLVTVLDPWNPIAGLENESAQTRDAYRRQESERLLEAAAARWSPSRVRTKVIDGWAPRALMDQARAEGSELICLGMHGRRRSTAYVLGSVATTVLHEATCSVYLARVAQDADQFPGTVVIGVDGSADSLRAAAVAADLVERFGVELRPVIATGAGRGLLDKGTGAVDVDAARSAFPRAALDTRSPVDALVGTAKESEADIVIVGARGLRGLRAMGSVSERVAHEATCSVLVVRP